MGGGGGLILGAVHHKQGSRSPNQHPTLSPFHLSAPNICVSPNFHLIATAGGKTIFQFAAGYRLLEYKAGLRVPLHRPAALSEKNYLHMD